MSEGNWKIFKLFSGAAALFCCLLIALGFKIYYALDTHQPVLTGDYYEIGRNFDEYRRKNRNTENRRLDSPVLLDARQAARVQLQRGVNLVPVEYRRTGAAAAPVVGARVSFKLSRRATVNDDVQAGCLTDQQGRCELRLEIPGSGYWEGSLEALEADGDARFVQRRVFEIP